jgi:hypothetical protein
LNLVNEPHIPELKQDPQAFDEARARATLDDIAARPLEDRADAVEALVARLESELDATSVDESSTDS